MCHFYICMDIHNTCGNANGIKVWADYFFPVLDGAPEDVQFPILDDEIHQKMVSSAHEDVVLEEDGTIYEKGDKFKSFHRQVKHHISQKAFLARILLVWLKKCVISSPLHDGILSSMLLPAVQLAYDKSLGLLPSMVYSIQREFRALIEAFCRPLASKRGKGQVLPHDGPCLRMKMPYTYLMAWFTLHCLAIIQPEGDPSESVRFAYLRRFEGSQWMRTYTTGVQKLVCCYDMCSLYRCFPSIPGDGYGEEFQDVGDRRSSLG